MHFYRLLSPIKAITFDLDGTLYDNNNVINKSEEEVLLFIRKYDHCFNNFSKNDLSIFRKLVEKQNPEIYHNITKWRRLSVETMLYHYGFNNKELKKAADKIMAHFMYWRNKINISESTHKILTKLVKKIPLGAITNGNVDTKACGLDKYFQFVLKAGTDGRLKPFNDMYKLAIDRLNIESKFVLHVGDNLFTDIEGAINSNMQACWINTNKINLIKTKNINVLPHVEIYNLKSLLCIIK
ncbi:Flavin mononucleotide phosphatase YigB [Candidatus Providencia siddallii]|uniref:Flavin mononucleotide phosphatase YigB n=1 Tax=Candidatus Providencia siddallii TaxID=1715285 RepID=A0A0M6W849_9GAMM|nr:Flavin mononucleotide phosphatase YigB [Candidatus Providencia siddallii]